jgi:hypothetical protein
MAAAAALVVTGSAAMDLGPTLRDALKGLPVVAAADVVADVVAAARGDHRPEA